ncbi:MAG: DnaB-like helicase C-terminal domain-containing protein, partial [Bacilli bacterium]|nr:DnaB-like helicase C-terminal domain-containing protein [Bacilli bacterium]
MIQLQVINYILYKKDVEILTNYNSNFFPSYENIYDFIKTHYIKYKVIPDKSTVANKFKDTNYSYFDVDESREYLITELEDEYIMKKVASIVNGEGEQLTINPRQVMANIQRELGNISMPKKTYGVNILDESETENRYNKFLERFNCVDEDVYTFSTGLEKLDEALDRIRREEELIVLYARTNNGKSFIAEKIAASVCEAGHKVGFFSPEMSKDEIGYRYDTLLSNLSNRGMRGNNKDFNADMYRSFMKKLGKSGKY